MGKALPAAVLLDMDGTLVDTEPYWIAEENALVESYGGTWTEELAHRCVGNPLLVSAQIIRENSPVDLPAEEVVQRLLGGVVRRMSEHVPWRPGAAQLLAECRELAIPTALVTMSYTSFAQVLLDTQPEGTFVAVVTGDVVRRGKPDPEPYLVACEQLGVQPQDAIAVEDSVPGVTSAVAAGVPTIAVPHVVRVPPMDGAVQVDSLQGLGIADLWSLATQAGRVTSR